MLQQLVAQRQATETGETAIVAPFIAQQVETAAEIVRAEVAATRFLLRLAENTVRAEIDVETLGIAQRRPLSLAQHRFAEVLYTNVSGHRGCSMKFLIQVY